MKKVTLTLILVSTLLLGWASTEEPEGHVEESDSFYDGRLLSSSFSEISTLKGTAHRGGIDQTDANGEITQYSIYLRKDLDRDGDIDSRDEPVSAETTLSSDVTGTDTTIPIGDTSHYLPSGFAIIENELIKYDSKDSTSLNSCTRGYNETSAASHTSGTTIESTGAWEKVLNKSVTPYDAVGWDVSGEGADDGTPGNLIQDTSDNITVDNMGYLIFIRVTDINGKTNLDGSFTSYGVDSYVDGKGDGSSAISNGLEDDEVVNFTVALPVERF